MGKYVAGEGRCRLEAQLIRQGEDLLVRIFGGTKPHVGAVAIGIPRPSLSEAGKTSASVSVFTLTGHKDDVLAREAADYLAAAANRTVVVVAGFHIDSAGRDEIRAVCENCRQLLLQLKEDLTGAEGSA